MITVVPSAPQAQSIAFSVAPTLGSARLYSHPRSLPPGMAQWRAPPSSRMSAPKARIAERWRSMGRGPNSHPPGILNSAAPVRAKMAPRKITEERISRISSSGTSLPVTTEASTVTVAPSRVTLHPRCSKIAREARTSERSGQLCITLVPRQSTVAARMGSTLFMAPWTSAVPYSGLPPWMIYALMFRRPSTCHGLTPSYAEEAAGDSSPHWPYCSRASRVW